MASSRPRRETASLYGRPRPPVSDEGSGLGVASTGGQRRRTRVSRRQRTPSPPPSDEVMEEEHVTATPEDEVEDEDVRQTQDEAAEDEATEGEAAEGDSSATPTVYQRCPTSLPQPSLPHNRALIRPMAKR